MLWTFNLPFFNVTASTYMRESPINKNFRALLGLFYLNWVNLVKLMKVSFI